MISVEWQNDFDWLTQLNFFKKIVITFTIVLLIALLRNDGDLN